MGLLNYLDQRGFDVVKFNKLHRATDGDGENKPTEGFDVLIERAAMLIVASSTYDSDDELASLLYKQANDCMIEAAHSPFFGGNKASIMYEGIDVVRDLVFERVRDELITRGYPLPRR